MPDRRRPRWWPGLTGQVVVIYGLARAISAVMLVVVAPSQQPAAMTDGDYVGYFGFTRIWDGEWYQRVADDGYPSTLPRDPDGSVLQNPWAFYPLFPLVARVGVQVTGLSFAVVASTLALLLGFAAAIVMAHLLRERVGDRGSLIVVGLYAVFPAAPALQVSYTESLAMLLLCSYLWALTRQRWLLATGLALLVGVSRPIALPLGAVTLIAVWLRWRRRGPAPIRAGEGWSMAAALVGCGVAGIEWPVVAWIGTGEPMAYVQTMGAWSAGGQVRWFTPWLTTSSWYLGTAGPLLVFLLVVLLIAGMAGPWARRLGPVLRTWSLAYPAYLMAAQGPGTSTPRYLLMLFPYLVVLLGLGWAQPRRLLVPTWLRAGVLAVVFLWLQWKWVSVLWHFTPPTDWAP